jgi:hypothetical protein
VAIAIEAFQQAGAPLKTRTNARAMKFGVQDRHGIRFANRFCHRWIARVVAKIHSRCAPIN